MAAAVEEVVRHASQSAMQRRADHPAFRLRPLIGMSVRSSRLIRMCGTGIRLRVTARIGARVSGASGQVSPEKQEIHGTQRGVKEAAGRGSDDAKTFGLVESHGALV